MALSCTEEIQLGQEKLLYEKHKVPEQAAQGCGGVTIPGCILKMWH